MKNIPFPTHYRRSLREGRKTMTVRLDQELGKYTKGEILRATSYAGNDWGIDIKVIKVIRTTIGRLNEHGVPGNSVEGILKKGYNSETEVDLVIFRKE
jgi:uncharacterized protein YqfB (UPF0267 family)